MNLVKYRLKILLMCSTFMIYFNTATFVQQDLFFHILMKFTGCLTLRWSSLPTSRQLYCFQQIKIHDVPVKIKYFIIEKVFLFLEGTTTKMGSCDSSAETSDLFTLIELIKSYSHNLFFTFIVFFFCNFR